MEQVPRVDGSVYLVWQTHQKRGYMHVTSSRRKNSQTGRNQQMGQIKHRLWTVSTVQTQEIYVPIVRTNVLPHQRDFLGRNAAVQKSTAASTIKQHSFNLYKTK